MAVGSFVINIAHYEEDKLYISVIRRIYDTFETTVVYIECGLNIDINMDKRLIKFFEIYPKSEEPNRQYAYRPESKIYRIEYKFENNNSNDVEIKSIFNKIFTT